MITIDEKARRVSFGWISGHEARILLDQLRRVGLTRLNITREIMIDERNKMVTANVGSDRAELIFNDPPLWKRWTGVTYPKKQPLTEDEIMLLRMIAP